MAIAANAKKCPLCYNKNNKIIVKLNNKLLIEKMKKQTPKENAYRIDIYFIENYINIIKLCIILTLLCGDIAIQSINKKETEKLRGDNGWIKIFKNQVKLTQKQYGIIILRISISKIDLKKAKKTNEKIMI